MGGDTTGACACYDCGRRYGDQHGFPDLVIPDDAWARISPIGHVGGLLCPSCICKRLHDRGIECAGVFTSGPLSASPPPPPPPPSGAAWGVKPLIWAKAALQSKFADRLAIRVSETILGTYAVEKEGDLDFVVTLAGLTVCDRQGYRSIEAALAAAQTDFEARIRSVLSPAPSYAEGVGAALIRMVDRWLNDDKLSLEEVRSVVNNHPLFKRAIRNLAGKPPAEDGWLDISTAPKDGTDILVFPREPWKVPSIAHWYEPWKCWMRAGEDPPSPFYGERYGIGAAVPIKWSPLPAPPNVKVAP